MSEIGSEFYLYDTSKKYIKQLPNWLEVGDDQILLLSGRTAIDYVLEDIPRGIKNVYMPSYCCESMLQPFLEKNIYIYYYDVIFHDNTIEYSIDFEIPCDIFFATSYFGFSSTVMDSAIEIFANRDVIVIEDITHRLLSEQMYCKKAHYSIASIRKWFAMPSGGIAIKQKGTFLNRNLKSPDEIAEIKIAAMQKKANCLFNQSIDSNTRKTEKQNYLNLFAEFNKKLRFNYKEIEIDSLSRYILSSVDIEVIKKKRRENASYLYKALLNYNFVKPIIYISDFTKDCPLFLPVRVRSDFRDRLKTYLAKNEIYCPTHWPVSNLASLNTRTSKVYDEELSLICDQRYNIEDMKRIINKIGEFWRYI